MIEQGVARTQHQKSIGWRPQARADLSSLEVGTGYKDQP